MFNFVRNWLFLNETDTLPIWSCGKSPVANGVARIIGGQNAVRNSYPWMVLLETEFSTDLYKCGGVLLSQLHVLTAAHCMIDDGNPQNVTVFAGIHHREDSKYRVLARTITIHPWYDKNTFANDIAIVTLRSALPSNDSRIGTICLPSDNPLLPNRDAVAIGWGCTTYDGDSSEILKEVTLRILDASIQECRQEKLFPARKICAGELGGGRDTCQGDSGGPLMIRNADGRWEVIGITSYGAARCLLAFAIVSIDSDRIFLLRPAAERKTP
ncbi:unnamed protein product [Rotaria sp. Silwood1]|nr:unnamed protein product [Rotaria sp. Silwood1]